MLKQVIFILFFIMGCQGFLFAQETEEDTHGEISLDVEKGLTLYAKSVLPCEKGDEAGPKCTLLAIYDQRDDYIYLVNKAVNDQNMNYGSEGFNREDVQSDAYQTVDMVKMYPHKKVAVKSSTAIFAEHKGHLDLKLKIQFDDDVKHIEKVVEKVYYSEK